MSGFVHSDGSRLFAGIVSEGLILYLDNTLFLHKRQVTFTTIDITVL